MKYLKKISMAAIAAMSFTAFAASSASATILEVGGATKNEKIEITGVASLAPRASWPGQMDRSPTHAPDRTRPGTPKALISAVK